MSTKTPSKLDQIRALREAKSEEPRKAATAGPARKGTGVGTPTRVAQPVASPAGGALTAEAQAALDREKERKAYMANYMRDWRKGIRRGPRRKKET